MESHDSRYDIDSSMWAMNVVLENTPVSNKIAQQPTMNATDSSNTLTRSPD
jgi:hypothetical protein